MLVPSIGRAWRSLRTRWQILVLGAISAVVCLGVWRLRPVPRAQTPIRTEAQELQQEHAQAQDREVLGANRGSDGAVPVARAHDYLPCTAGLALEYRFSAAPGAGRVDTVRGRQGKLCIVDRVTRVPGRQDDVGTYAREMLEDRITEAGWIDRLTAFRKPLLVDPIVEDARWSFGGVTHRVRSVGATIDLPAGRLEDVAWVDERSIDGVHQSALGYARGIGLVVTEKDGARMEAVRIARPASPDAGKVEATVAPESSQAPTSAPDLRARHRANPPQSLPTPSRP